MFRKIPFVKSELETVGEIPGMFGRPGTPIRNTPVSHRENITSLYYEKKPYWIPISLESRMFGSNLYSTRLSRGSGKDQTDVFGIEWEFVPAVGGSIVSGRKRSSSPTSLPGPGPRRQKTCRWIPDSLTRCPLSTGSGLSG